MHRHDHRCRTSPQLAMAPSLTDVNEAGTDECLDNLGPSYDGERRIQAESWNVVTVG